MKRLFLCCLAVVLAGCVSNKAYKTAADESEARRVQLESVLQELKQARQSVENSGKELEGSRQANEKLKKDMDELSVAKDKEISSLKGRLDELSSKGATTSKEVQSLKQDRERLSASEKAKTGEIERLKQEIADMTKAKGDEIAATKQDAERLVKTKEEETAAVRQEKEYLGREVERLKVKAGEISSEKEKEIANVKSTYETLVKEMQKEIEKGDIKITQAVDRLSVNLVEKILFDSGEAEVKPEGLNILKRVGDILKGVSDKQIRIEGYTDNVKLGAKLRQRYPTNWELSTARATNVVRYLQDKVGVDPRRLSAAGLSEYKPVASNETTEGRAQNRRIEIVLLPLDVDRVLEELKK